MTRHMGNITVTEANALDFPAVSEIYGHLTIASGAQLTAPNLVAVRGWVTLQPGAQLTAPLLGSINGWLTLAGWPTLEMKGARLTAPHLTEVTADLTIGLGVDTRLPELLTVGSLILRDQAEASFAALQAISGNLSLGVRAYLDANQLTSVGKSITLRDVSSLSAPSLAHIGGYYDAEPTAMMYAPKFGG